MLRGAIPLSVGNLKILRVLDFEDETPGDAIPSQLSGLAALQVPGLRKNRFAGVLPAALARVPALQALNTRVNDLRREISGRSANVSTLRIVCAGGRLFSGCIPIRMRITMARTSGEKIQGSSTRWLVLPGPGSAAPGSSSTYQIAKPQTLPRFQVRRRRGLTGSYRRRR